MNKNIAVLLLTVFAVFSLVACGISADVHDAVVAEKEAAQASVTQLEQEKETALASVTQLEQENESVKADLAKAQGTVENLNAIYPPKRFKDRNAIAEWLRNDDISERPITTYPVDWLLKALEQQSRALEDGYIVSAEFTGPDEYGDVSVWLSAVVENSDQFVWEPESDEVAFTANVEKLSIP